jgi:hypothetical protein
MKDELRRPDEPVVYIDGEGVTQGPLSGELVLLNKKWAYGVIVGDCLSTDVA